MNDNDLVRSAAVQADARVFPVRLGTDADASVLRGTHAELPAYLAGGDPSAVYWLTFDGGDVSAVCEQYRP